MSNFKIKNIRVDGERVAQLWVDGIWINEIDIHSQMTAKEARTILIENYKGQLF